MTDDPQQLRQSHCIQSRPSVDHLEPSQDESRRALRDAVEHAALLVSTGRHHLPGLGHQHLPIQLSHRHRVLKGRTGLCPHSRRSVSSCRRRVSLLGEVKISLVARSETDPITVAFSRSRQNSLFSSFFQFYLILQLRDTPSHCPPSYPSSAFSHTWLSSVVHSRSVSLHPASLRPFYPIGAKLHYPASFPSSKPQILTRRRYPFCSVRRMPCDASVDMVRQQPQCEGEAVAEEEGGCFDCYS